MVESITPTYYATGESPTVFTLQGHGFEYIPDDAIAVYAIHNNNPLEYKDTTVQDRLYSIVEKTPTTIVLEHNKVTTVGSPTYLGAILSSDRQIVYWVNETEPLPRNSRTLKNVKKRRLAQ